MVFLLDESTIDSLVHYGSAHVSLFLSFLGTKHLVGWTIVCDNITIKDITRVVGPSFLSSTEHVVVANVTTGNVDAILSGRREANVGCPQESTSVRLKVGDLGFSLLVSGCQLFSRVALLITKGAPTGTLEGGRQF